MALTGTDRGQGTNNTAGTSFTLSPASNFAAGMAVLCLAVDNNGSGGALLGTFTVTDSLGNTWTRRSSPIYDPGAALAGVEGAFFTTPQDGGLLATGTVITVSFGATSVTAKVWTLMQVSSSTGIPIFKTQAVGTGSATASPTVTTASIPGGHMVIGGVFNEQGTAQTPTGDSDTTNGSWSAMQTAEIGTTAAGVTIITQRKVVTVAGTQTYNPTLGTSSDVIAAWIQLGEQVNVDPSLGQATFAGFVPLSQVTSAVNVSTGLGEPIFTGFSPLVQISDHKRVDVGLGQVTFAGFSAVLERGLVPGLGQSTFAGFSPAVEATSGLSVLVGVGQSTFAGFSPTIQVSDHKQVNAQLGQATFAGFAPTVAASNHKRVDAGLAQSVFTGFSPTIQISNHKRVDVGVGQPVFTGFAPSIQLSIFPGPGQTLFAGFSPVVQISLIKNLDVGVGQLAFAGFSPTVQTSNNTSVSVNCGQAVFTGFDPVIEIETSSLELMVGSGQLIFTCYAPLINFQPTTIELSSPITNTERSSEIKNTIVPNNSVISEALTLNSHINGII